MIGCRAFMSLSRDSYSYTGATSDILQYWPVGKEACLLHLPCLKHITISFRASQGETYQKLFKAIKSSPVQHEDEKQLTWSP